MFSFLFILLLLLFDCSSSYSALAKPTLDNNIDSSAQSAFTSTSGADAFQDYLFSDEATTPNSNPSIISLAIPSSSDLLLSSEALPKSADINSFTSSESLCQGSGRTQTNSKLRIRDQQPGFCKSPYSQQIKQPEIPSVQPLPHATDYGSDYEENRPAVSPEDKALSEKDREKALREQNKALPDNDPLKCARPPFFIPVCCLGSLDLADLIVQGQTVFDQVEYCVSCKFGFFFSFD